MYERRNLESVRELEAKTKSQVILLDSQNKILCFQMNIKFIQ